MKKVLRSIGVLLLITALIISLIPASDVEASSTSDFQMEGSKLVKYSGTAEVVSIPDEVRTIGEEAFAGNNNILKIKINDKCRAIEYGAFARCNSLKSVEIGDAVEEIGAAAFANDPSLDTIYLGAAVKKLGSGIFAGDTGIKNLSVSAGNSHLRLENNVLYNADKTKLYLMLPTYDNPVYEMPNSVTEVSGYAFWGNDKLTNVTVSSGLYSVPEYAFSNCQNLRQVKIPLPVKSIDAKAFEDCVNLREAACPESMTYISDTAFDGCPNVTINATPGSYAYEFGQNLRKNQVEEIEYEDVEDAALVTTNVVNVELPQIADTPKVQVIQGKPAPAPNSKGKDIEVESNRINLLAPQDGIKEDSSSDEEQNTQSDDSPSVNEEAMYSTGVINGYDVVSYNYYPAEEEPTGPFLGSSSVVGGRALIFIDNNANVRGGNSNKLDLTENNQPDNSEDNSKPKRELNPLPALNKSNSTSGDNSGTGESSNESGESEGDSDTASDGGIGDIIQENASKGIDFPKFTIVGDRIAAQSYYLDSALDEYDIPKDITTIGDFAFARSSLKSIKIPKGVKTIGYGAFYHCDSLTSVDIPDTVTSIGANAFADTPFVKNNASEFVIVGDGVLIAYNGSESVVTIPEGVKLIADGTFRDHQGITAVNLADTLTTIGEDAFNGCQNLRTLNRGENVTTIGANAFKGTALNNVTIHPSVKSIGTGAFSLKGGTDTVYFEGTSLPILTEGSQAKRLANNTDRTYVFGDMKKAIISSSSDSINGTVLEPGQYGFHGVVVNEFGNTVSDNSNGVNISNHSGIKIDANSAYINAPSVEASIVGDDGAYTLHITDSQNAKESISLAYSELYGGRTPENLVGIDMSLKDASDTLDITKLGKQVVNVTMDIPSGVSASNLHVVALDEDGQLEAVAFTFNDERNAISMKCEHFSPYGFYNYGGSNADVLKEGTHIKDDTPDTGDLSINAKWFLVVGCVSLALLLFLISNKKYKNTI